jgi:alkaline phosphatase
MITDSANSASAFLTGQKGWNSALNVYVDTSADPLDDPKVESLAQYIRRYKPGMCIGVVTTAEITDATPASVFAHTRDRNTVREIVDQMINGFGNLSWTPPSVKADVLFGGGGRSFCQTIVNGNVSRSCSTLGNRNYFEDYAKLGYTVVKDKDQLEAHKGNGPILGIFNLRSVDTWIDRNLYTNNVQKVQNDPEGRTQAAMNQPGLELMTMKAIEVMSAKCNDGFFLLSEAAHIDKSMHSIDYDRGLGDLLELDRTVQKVRQWAEANKSRGETGIIVTADHSQAYDVYGSVDTQYFNAQPETDTNIVPNPTGSQQFLQIQKRKAFGEYEFAGWPDLVVDERGMPTKWEGRFRLLGGKVDAIPHREDFQIKKDASVARSPASRLQSVRDANMTTLYNQTILVENPAEKGILYLGSLSAEAPSTVHSLQAVDIYCYGPLAFRAQCGQVMDNTELFFVMADALGLGNGDRPALPEPPVSSTTTGTKIATSATNTATATNTVSGTVTTTQATVTATTTLTVTETSTLTATATTSTGTSPSGVPYPDGPSTPEPSTKPSKPYPHNEIEDIPYAHEVSPAKPGKQSPSGPAPGKEGPKGGEYSKDAPAKEGSKGDEYSKDAPAPAKEDGNIVSGAYALVPSVLAIALILLQ